jgi:hypothetical protein
MFPDVEQALLEQREAMQGQGQYVFSNTNGGRYTSIISATACGIRRSDGQGFDQEIPSRTAIVTPHSCSVRAPIRPGWRG